MSSARLFDPFGTRDTFEVGGKKIGIYRLSKLEQLGLCKLAELPYSIRILLEAVLRNCDGYEVTEDDVKGLAGWKAEAALLRDLPGLSREDIRLLAAVGIHRAHMLTKFTAEELWQRIQRFRGSTPQPWHAWIRDRNSWPREEEIAEWIAIARMSTGEHRDLLALTSAETDDDEPDDDGPKPAGEHDHSSRKRTRRSRRARFSAASTRPRWSSAAFVAP